MTSSAIHQWEETISKVTARRAYLGRGHWFSLDDPRRVVKPAYLDYVTLVVATRNGGGHG